MLNSVTHHALHHEKFRANFGLYFNVWDRLMGTNHRDYEHRFAQATAGPSYPLATAVYKKISAALFRERRTTSRTFPERCLAGQRVLEKNVETTNCVAIAAKETAETALSADCLGGDTGTGRPSICPISSRTSTISTRLVGFLPIGTWSIDKDVNEPHELLAEASFDLQFQPIHLP